MDFVLESLAELPTQIVRRSFENRRLRFLGRNSGGQGRLGIDTVGRRAVAIGWILAGGQRYPSWGCASGACRGRGAGIGFEQKVEDVPKRGEVVERQRSTRGVGGQGTDVEVFLQFTEELGLLDAVDAQVSFQIGIQVDDFGRIAGLFDDEVDQESFQFDGLLGGVARGRRVAGGAHRGGRRVLGVRSCHDGRRFGRGNNLFDAGRSRARLRLNQKIEDMP